MSIEPKSKNRIKRVIGWQEYVSFPEWGISRLKAKIDTGARTSAIHADSIERVGEVEGDDGEIRDVIKMEISLDRKGSGKKKTVRAEVVKRGWVRDSGGHRTKRPFVETTIRIGPFRKRILISVINRDPMLHRMILGRSFLEEGFIVDVSKRYLLGKRRRQKV